MRPHGYEARYCDGCRCDECRAAHAAGARRRRRAKAYGRHVPKSVPAIGARRRVEALMCLGWSMRSLSRQLGDWHEDRLHALFSSSDGISPANHARIAALYDQLWNTPAPQTTRGERIAARTTFGRAARRGYLPPLAWDDDDIDNPDAGPANPPPGGIRELAPCGTSAAARRHYRRGEPLDTACLAASNRARAERRTAA